MKCENETKQKKKMNQKYSNEIFVENTNIFVVCFSVHEGKMKKMKMKMKAAASERICFVNEFQFLGER